MGKSVKGTKTEQNLLKSFAGESQARTRYTFFASKAKKEGFEQIAGVFAETADQEKEHAERFFKFLEGGMLEITASYPAGKIGTTMENLIEAAAGENEEWSELYPTFAKVAEEEGFPVIAAVFLLVQKARIHSPRIVAMLANLTKCGLGIYLAHYFFIGPAYLATVALGLPAALRVPVAAAIVLSCTWTLIFLIYKLPKAKYIVG